MTSATVVRHARTARHTRAAAAMRAMLLADRWLLAVVAGASVATITFAAYSIVRYHSYRSTAMDFAFFDQIVWNTSQGRWFETSFVPYNFMGQHIEPVLLVFALLYRVTPAPEWMLVTQALSAGIAGVFLYLFARQRLSRRWLAALVTASFLLSPMLHAVMAFDYHSEALAPMFVFGGLALLFSGRPNLGLVVLLGTLTLKEDAALLLIGLSLPLWLNAFRRQAATLAIVGVIWIVVVVGIVMPTIRGGASDLDQRYTHLGVGASGMLNGMIRDPLATATYAAGDDQRQSVFRLLMTQGAIPLLAPATLVAAMPVAALQFLSSHPPQQALKLQYGAQVLPIVVFATVEGLRRVEQARRHADVLTRIAAIALVCGIGYSLATVSLALVPDAVDEARSTPVDDAAVERAISRIPPDAAVSAQTGIAAHMSQREHVWEFPVLNTAEFVVLDLNGVVARVYEDVYDAEVLALPSKGYRLVWSDGSVRMYQKEAQ